MNAIATHRTAEGNDTQSNISDANGPITDPVVFYLRSAAPRPIQPHRVGRGRHKWPGRACNISESLLRLKSNGFVPNWSVVDKPRGWSLAIRQFRVVCGIEGLPVNRYWITWVHRE